MEWIGGLAAVIALIFIFMEKSNGNNDSNPYTIEPTGDSSIYKVVDEQGNIKTYGTYQQCEEWINSQ